METKDFADRETSVLLKKLGFHEECLMCYFDGAKKPNEAFERMDSLTDYNDTENPEGYYSAPLWYQIKNWLWEKHQVYFQPYYAWKGCFGCRILKSKTGGLPNGLTTPIYSPVEAEIEALKVAVKDIHDNIDIYNT